MTENRHPEDGVVCEEEGQGCLVFFVLCAIAVFVAAWA